MLSVLIAPNDEAMQQEVQMEFGSGVEDLLVPEKLNVFFVCNVAKLVSSIFNVTIMFSFNIATGLLRTSS